MITPIAGVTPTKPGSATLPFFGVKPELYDESGNVLKDVNSGNLVIEQSWPSQIRSAPFGFPVEPDVYSIKRGSSESIG